jgi:SAM-dependent methyltransferase
MAQTPEPTWTPSSPRLATYAEFLHSSARPGACHSSRHPPFDVVTSILKSEREIPVWLSTKSGLFVNVTPAIDHGTDGRISVVQCPEGEIQILPLSSHRRRIEVRPYRADIYIARRSVDTAYSDELILACLELAGFCWLCDNIARDEDSSEVERDLSLGMFSFVPKEKFRECRLLDFGCGSGSSTAVLGRLLPNTEIVGVELNPALLKLASARMAHHGVHNVRFEASPSGTQLPENLGSFDFILFSAVYEHLLPKERDDLMPLVWRTLRPGGVLFINQTPHRYFPVDTHSSGLPLVNYLPDRLTHWAVVRFSKRGKINQSPVWEEHLRGGLRGATEAEILAKLSRGSDDRPALLEPCIPGLKDRVDLWFWRLSPRYRAIKRAAWLVLKAVYLMTGSVVSPNIAVAIQKTS